MKTFATEPRPEPRRPVPCALCGGRSFDPLWDCGAFSFVSCRGCGLAQQNPQPEPSAVALRYDAAYLEYEAENQLAYRDLELLALRDLGLGGRAAPGRPGSAYEERGGRDPSGTAGRSPEEGAPRPRALDVGCATGALLDALRDLGWEPEGVELCAPAAEYGRARYRLPIHAGSLESARFPAGSFDLVHASHLIEHLNDPAAFLAEVDRVLAPGGRLVLTTPNAAGFQARLLGADWRSAIYDHLYLFSRRTLAALLRGRGFAVERIVTWGGWARGLEPAFLKRPLDAIAKRTGLGDVMALLARRAGP